MSCEHETWMRLAIEEAELARGTTGDNPWVGCALANYTGVVLPQLWLMRIAPALAP
jgi:pyrimidine deaminase RibD-like protein